MTVTIDRLTNEKLIKMDRVMKRKEALKDINLKLNSISHEKTFFS